jgi:hypothetical protein
LALPWLLIAATLVFWLPTINADDAKQLYNARLDHLYDRSVLAGGGFVYSPAAAQVMDVLHLIPWPVFVALILVGSMLVAGWAIGPWLVLILLIGQLPVMFYEVRLVQTNFLIGAVIWAGFRYPALWSVVLLTKLTPGIGLLWFAVRREWRALVIAVGATTLIAGVSFAFAPQLWADWFAFLLRSTSDADSQKVMPLVIRLGAAAAIVIWGALNGKPWVVPVAAVVAHVSLAWALAAPALGYALGRLVDPVNPEPARRRVGDRARVVDQDLNVVGRGEQVVG